jgi:hypothetical protein
MVGPAAEGALVRELSETITAVAPSLRAFRLRTVLDTNMSAAFANCSVPVLYLRGTGDRLVSKSSFRHMESLRPMSVARVPGPHLLLQANPTAVWSAIKPLVDCCLQSNGPTLRRAAEARAPAGPGRAQAGRVPRARTRKGALRPARHAPRTTDHRPRRSPRDVSRVPSPEPRVPSS